MVLHALFLIFEQLHEMDDFSVHSLNIKTEMLARSAALYAKLHSRPGGNAHTQVAAFMVLLRTNKTFVGAIKGNSCDMNHPQQSSPGALGKEELSSLLSAAQKQ